jgi:DNA modification methylase
MNNDDVYVTDDAQGDGWSLMLGDSCERLAEVGTASVDLSVCSPPFASLYTYSPSLRDLGNSGSREEFLTHYRFIIRAQLRVTKPGRHAVVHVSQIALTKAVHGEVGLSDFRGDVIRAFVGEGWIFHGEVTIDKDPQAQAIRTKAQALMFVQLERDSSKNRPALADYLLIFRKPGENKVPVKPEVSRDEWIQWARPIWQGEEDSAETLGELGLVMPRAAWYGIKETNTLNAKVARENADERHICPLQLDLIERCVRLWSNRGELVLSPFAGIGSEGYVSVRQGRRFVGVELKASYWQTAVTNLRTAEAQVAAPALFGESEAAAS